MTRTMAGNAVIAPTLTEATNSRDLGSTASLQLKLADVTALDTPYFRLKRGLDVFLALLLLIPALPLIGLLVVVVRWTSQGSGIYSQLRVGLGGRIFTLYKIRSMRSDAESSLGPAWAGTEADSRVTRLGYWLRRLHLDELPQLVNVLRGEMSLVGPRPERPEFVSPLADQIPGYLDRLRVLPGITGLAQVNLPADTDVESVRRKLFLDLDYLSTAGISLDLRILLCTLGRVFGLRGRRVLVMLGLQRTVVSLGATTRTDCRECGPRALSTVLFANDNVGDYSASNPCVLPLGETLVAAPANPQAS
jgi:lipopolysaccharide/colanic/teichoic acid biosynthesis glycosyltransferase